MQILRKTGLKGLEKAKRLGSRGVIRLLKEKKITGRGGAGFPTWKKWKMALNAQADIKYVICNADEGESGTIKDRFILMNNPEAVIEGIMIASYVLNAKESFIYLRGEYSYLKKPLEKVIRKLKVNIRIILGAGAYICGEETAILESIEGKRPHVREKPPYPVEKGLYGKPTLINNVETLADVAIALAFDDYNPELKLFSVAGNVTKPGVYELHSNIKLYDLINMAKPKKKIKAVYFGCFGGCIPYTDIELTTENVCRMGALLGSGTIIAVDESHSIVDVATNIAKFYEFESCGKCTPCREGTNRILELLERISVGKGKLEDIKTIEDIALVMRDTAGCGLGRSASNHILTALKFFRQEFEERVK